LAFSLYSFILWKDFLQNKGFLILDILYKISAYSQDILWLTIIYISLKKRTYWKGYKSYLLYYFIVILFIEIVAAITVFYLENNLFITNIYITLEFVLMANYVVGIIENKSATIILIVLFQIYSAFYLNGIIEYDTLGSNVTTGFQILLLFVAIWHIFQSKPNKSLLNLPEVWFIFGFFTIYALTILFNFFYILNLEYKDHKIFHYINNNFNFLKLACMLLFLVGVRKIKILKSNN
jgi:hypothetical protein